jgi:4-hydroxyacetophenone monooxygenase
VGAIGHFNRPSVARFPGDERFNGRLFHTSRWPDDVDLAGKHVAIIGTGASSMQTVPAIVDAVSTLTIFQRTAQWARDVPHLNDPVRPAEEWLFRHLPYYGTWTRFTQFWRYGDGLLRFLKKDPDWPHPERSLNRINDRHRQEMTDHILRELDGRPDLIEKCVPTYPPYGKRILLDKGWYAALRKPDVHLVTTPIQELDDAGLITADGTHYPADVIIVATGFNVTDHAARLNVTGRNSRRLSDDWADDNPRAHLGITVPGFPNLFLMGGPNTNAGHGGSGFLMAEAQTRYITSAIVALLSSGKAAMDVDPAVRDECIEQVDAEHETLIWTHPGMSTYYRNRFGRVVSPMPFRLIDYWHATKAVNPIEFHWT